MKKPFILRFVGTIVLSVFMCTLAAQDGVTTQNEDYYKQFQDLENGELRSFFFFNTPNRYNQNSPYDWLDTVKVYLNSSEKTKDSISIRKLSTY